MPPPPLIASSSLRHAMVALLMACLLAGALALGWTLGGTRPVQMADLAFRVPQRWTQTRSEVNPPGAELVHHYQPASRTLPLLVVAQHPPVSALSPRQALEQIRQLPIHDGVSASGRDVSVAPIRVGALVGMRLASASFPLRQRGLAQTRLLAVLTLDGSRYWSISLTNLTPVSDNRVRLDELPFERELFDRVVSSAVIVGVGGETLENLRFSDPPRLRVDAGADTSLRALRVRRELDVTGFESDALLSPALLLSRVYWRLLEAPPPDGAVTHEASERERAWRLTLPHQPNGLIGELWYLSRGQGEAAIARLVCEPSDLESARAWCARELASLSFANPSSALDAPVRRGVDLARASLELLAAGEARAWTYTMIEHSGQAIGFIIEHALPRAPGAALPIRGLSKSVALGVGRVTESTALWAASDKNRDFAARFTTVADAQNAQTFLLKHEQDRLSLLKVEQNRAAPRWELHPTPAGYLPPMGEDRWPVEPIMSLAGDDSAALVWLTPPGGVSAPPAACLVSVAAGGGEQGWTLRLRPLLALDADTVTLDAQGRVLRYDQVDPSGSGAVIVTLRRVEREDVIRQFPAMEKNLDAWQNQMREEASRQPDP